MRTIVPLDRTMQLPLTLAGGLRTTFADLVSSPIPERLAALMRRLHADRNERSGEEHNNGPIDRRGTPQPDGSAVRRRTAGHHRSAEAALGTLLIGGRKHEPIHLEVARGL